MFLPFAGELELLPHLLRHYRRLGVDRILVDIQLPVSEDVHWLDPALSLLRNYDAEVVSIDSAAYSGTRKRREAAVAQHAESDDWIVIADADEFQVYPLLLVDVARQCEDNGYDHVVGRYVDRIACDGELVEPGSNHPARLMPCSAELTANILGGWISKVVMARPYIIVGEGNHEAYYGRRAPESELFAEVHHFKWYRGVLCRNRSMIDSIRRRGGTHYIEKIRFENLLRENGGRIPVDVPELAIHRVRGSDLGLDAEVPLAHEKLDPGNRFHWHPARTKGSRLHKERDGFVVRTPRGRQVAFSTAFPVDRLWTLLNGRNTLAQLVVRFGGILVQPRERILTSIQRILDSLEAINAIDYSPFTPARSYDIADISRSVAFDDHLVRLLYIDDEEPDHSKGFGFPRARRVLELLEQSGFEVTTFAARDSTVRPGSAVTPGRIADLKALLQAKGQQFDAVWVSRMRNLQAFVRAIDGDRMDRPLIFDAEAVTSLREILRLEQRGQPLGVEAQRDVIDGELDFAARADLVLAVSRREQAFFREGSVNPVLCVPLPHDITPTPSPFERRSGIFFLNSMYFGGTTHDAVDYLVGEIFPRLASVEELTLSLFGYGSESLRLPKLDPGIASRVRLCGFADDLFAMYNSHRVCVVPTRCSSGVAWKVIEAMAHGIPVVTTPLIADQLDDAGDAVLVGADANEMALRVLNLYEDSRLWERQREAGFDYVGRECSARSILDTLATIRNWIIYRNRFEYGNNSREAPTTHALSSCIPSPNSRVAGRTSKQRLERIRRNGKPRGRVT